MSYETLCTKKKTSFIQTLLSAAEFHRIMTQKRLAGSRKTFTAGEESNLALK